MRRGLGVGLSSLLGLAILFSIPPSLNGANWGGPQLALEAQLPIRNGDRVTLTGSGFEPGEVLTGFGAVVQIQNEQPPLYRGFNLPQLEVRTDASGRFDLEVPLGILAGITGHLELALYYQGEVINTGFFPVRDSGLYQPSGLDATAGTLYFLDGTFNHGGPGEDPVINGDDVPLTSDAQGDWAGTLFLVNLERYTSTDGTGTSIPYNNLNNDVAFSTGNLTATSSAIVAGLNVTYKSIRMTVLVWEEGNYSSIVGTTTTGTTQGQGWLSSADVTPPQVTSAQAISLTQIVVTFSENVTTPGTNAAAIDNWTVTFNGSKAVSALLPLGSSSTPSCTLTVANLGDRGATPTVQFTTGTNEFEDAAGNDCASTTSPHITASDGIAPATPTLDNPTSTSIMTGASVNWQASPGAGTDTSLDSLRFQGSNNGTTWITLGSHPGPAPYSGTYTFGTKYAYYRAQAVDDQSNIANSAATQDLQDAFYLDLTTIPPATQVNVESGQWTVTVKDNYGNSEAVTLTIGLNSESSGGRFRETSGGPTVGSINLTNDWFGTFYYIDSDVGIWEIKVTTATLQDDSTDYQITPGGASKLHVKLPGQTFTSGTGVTGTPDFSSYGGSLRWAQAGTGFPIVLYITDDDNNLVAETGSRDVDFTTTAGAAPNGTNPTLNGSTFPVNNLSIDFSAGESTTSITAIMYDFTDNYSTVAVTAADDAGGLTGVASAGFNVLFDDANHIAWTNYSGAVTSTPINGSQLVGSPLPTLYVSALDQYNNRDTTYTGSTITTMGGTAYPPTNSPSGKGQGGTSLPNGNTPPDYGTGSTWSKGTVTLSSGSVDERTIIYAATTTGFRIRAGASGGALDGQYTGNSDLFAVNYGDHNYVRVEDTSGGGGTEYVDGETFTTSDSVVFWAISYDQWCNTRGNHVVDWSSTNLTPTASGNSTHWTFEPTAPNSGDGTLTADAPTGTDRTISSITVTADVTIASVKIRTASGGGGSETGAMEIAGADNGGAYNVTAWMYVAGYNSDQIYISDVDADWAVTGTLTETGGSGFENSDPASSNRYTAVTSSNQSGYITATYNGATDSTGLVQVDATKPATVNNFDVTEDQNHYYVNAFWNPASSYDDGAIASSGNVEDFDIRFSAAIINDETDWDNATTVGTAGKPTFNGAWSWRIDMSGFLAGYYYYAIKTMDPQGNWSNMGTGCYTTNPDYSLPVTLASFQARGGYGKIIVTWSTESEVDALGFRLLRDTSSDYPDPTLVASYQTDPELICQGTGATGYDYTFVDDQNVDPEELYFYRLEAVDINGRIEASRLEASASALPLPDDYALEPNFPNPFNPVTHFELKLPETGRVMVSVYDVAGREVTRIVDGEVWEAGVYQLSWNGTDRRGLPVPSGLYFCRLQSDRSQCIIKMLLLK